MGQGGRAMYYLFAGVVVGSAVVAGASDLKIYSAADLATPGLNLQIINGEIADPKQWPSTFVFQTDEGGCTATAIGSQVLLTAAHCVGDGQKGRVVAGETTANVACTHHPDYPARISSDFALCFLDVALKMPELGFETLGSESGSPKNGQSVVLLGYGCRAKDGADRQFGALFKGAATVTHQPAEETYWYVVTSGAAVCFGDSGGGAFTKEGVGRRLFGVNSRGDIDTNSWLSATAGASFQQWARAWSKARGTLICGAGASPDICRQ